MAWMIFGGVCVMRDLGKIGGLGGAVGLWDHQEGGNDPLVSPPPWHLRAAVSLSFHEVTVGGEGRGVQGDPNRGLEVRSLCRERSGVGSALSPWLTTATPFLVGSCWW